MKHVKGSLIISMKVKDALLAGSDTRTCSDGAILYVDECGRTHLNDGSGKYRERVSEKMHIAENCVMSAAGKRNFSMDMYSKLCQLLKDGYGKDGQLLNSREIGFALQNLIVKEKPYSKEMKELVDHARFIISMWDYNENEPPTAKIIQIQRDKIIKGKRTPNGERNSNFACMGCGRKIAYDIIASKYREDMSVAEGKELIEEAIRAAALESNGLVGGFVKVCVILPRDEKEAKVLPSSKRLQQLDRSITFLTLGKIPEAKIQAPLPPTPESPDQFTSSSVKKSRK